MFRWLKDRNKKARKSSPSGSTRSKEDDYGFKQKQKQQQYQYQQSEYKRDLPPTPADLTSSCNVTDDDKSVHIYEEIPDLPFRCTPEGELRIHLAREASKKDGGHQSTSQGSTTYSRISPYMVVPLSERLRETPSEFRQVPPDVPTSSHDSSFTCALVGRKRPGDGLASRAVTSSPSCESPSQGASSPSCCGSSVFGSPLGVTGGGGEGGDMSDRLLSAINLTRLLAAVRLSSSSAETCTTSPICIGVDRDGRNISVSVSVTPTTSTNHHYHHQDNDDHVSPQHPTTQPLEATCGDSQSLSESHPQPDASGLVSGTLTSGLQSTSRLRSRRETNSSSKPGLKLDFDLASQSLSQDNAAGFEPETSDFAGEDHPESVCEVVQGQAGLRFLPSPIEQTALTEILHLRPGEKTALDPATIDALLLRLCSHTLQGEGAGLCQGAVLQRQELEAVENLLKNMVKNGEGQSDPNPDPDNPQPSPAVRRAENSDTGFEYDVSTSSESDQTSYDYFLSKAARTRSLECEVKKLIHSSDSGDDHAEEGVSEAGESIATLSTVSPTSVSPLSSAFTPEGDPGGDSDDGTMADLSESENSSGYYESARLAQASVSPGRESGRESGRGYGRESGKESGKGSGRRKTSSISKKKAAQSDVAQTEVSDVDLPCFELQCSQSVDTLTSDPSPRDRLSSHSTTPVYSQLAESVGSDPCLTEHLQSARPPHSKHSKGKCSGGCKKSRHHHREGKDRKRDKDSKHAQKIASAGDLSSLARRFSFQDTDSKQPEGEELRRGSMDNIRNKPPPSTSRVLKPSKSESGKRGRSSSKSSQQSSDYPYSLLYLPGGGRGSRAHKAMKAPKTSLDLQRSPSLHSSKRSLNDSVYGETRRQNSEVYSIPAALPDPSPSPGGSGGSGSGGGSRIYSAVPSKLSVARHVPESSEVYGTRAGTVGSAGCHNRLLSDIIMLNYNRQVLNM